MNTRRPGVRGGYVTPPAPAGAPPESSQNQGAPPGSSQNPGAQENIQRQDNIENIQGLDNIGNI